jgi:simple sugar transport system ATP-binding protein
MRHRRPGTLGTNRYRCVHAICDRIVVLFRGGKVADRDARSMRIEDTIASITGAHLRRDDSLGALE